MFSGTTIHSLYGYLPSQHHIIQYLELQKGNIQIKKLRFINQLKKKKGLEKMIQTPLKKTP